MKSIIYVGMDVHKSSFTLSCFEKESEKEFGLVRMQSDYKRVLKYLEEIKRSISNDEVEFLCGYEAGSLGYALYNDLTSNGIKCVILAPSTMPQTRKNRIKTDKLDAINISRCLAYKTYKAVHVPTKEDNAVKEYIRMRSAQKKVLKSIKYQILAFCLRNGEVFTEGKSHWTIKHISWLRKLRFEDQILQVTLEEYLIQYSLSVDRLSHYDLKIEDMAESERYRRLVQKLKCFKGINTLTALALIVETGDFKRFATASHYAAYLGLTPGESSSGDITRRTGITKAGNSHLRRLLVEAAQCYSRGKTSVKSKALKQRQKGNESNVIAYADRARERLARKLYMIMSRKQRNIAVTAVARELACFVWGMMTDNIY